MTEPKWEPSDLADWRDRAVRAESHAENLAAALALVLHDAHPTYGSTALWGGGAGGQAITSYCSIINGGPPGDGNWTQMDAPSAPLRDWLRDREERGIPFDLDAAKASMKARLNSLVGGSQ